MANSKGSEFGGVPGKIAPLPHELSAYEQHRLAMKIDPTDEATSVEDMRLLEAIAERRKTIDNPDAFTGDGSLPPAAPPQESAIRPVL
jgi:hypothetical protein